MGISEQPLPQRILVHRDQLRGDRLTLSPDQNHYLTRVLRLPPGSSFVAMFEDPVQPLTDAEPGRWWLCQLSSPSSPQLSPDSHPQIIQRVEEPSNTVPVTVLLAITKGGSFDEVLRQLTELGVAAIAPIQTARTVVVPGANKLKRWQRIITEAAEQCERSPLPKLLPPTTWADALTLPSLTHANPSRFICVARSSAQRSLLTALHTQSRSPQSHWMIAIGPEGGWTDEEKSLAIAAGFEPVSLGDRILRAVTASVAAMAIAAAVWEG